jgi:hypothetical protein
MQTISAPRFRTRQILRLRTVAWAAIFAVSTVAISAQSPSTTTHTIEQQGASMKHFVLLFQQGRNLSEEEQKRRADEIKAWAVHAVAEGWNPEPRALGKESYHLGPEGESASAQMSGDGLILVLLFIEASDFNEAVAIAKGHPAMRYGSHVEVREWTAPTLGPPQTPVQ